ncbi:PP2C family protein-serine/threonine phosphatase [Mycolicibacterium bacteremicum]|uniref:PP2C family protein-serine/threonine phosphatase n=1 Tax=Mycolicibacterium bacteremicum TaxID=564198 RepID=UPI0026E97D63|nr:GAF domain-containing SpoIIE family protein phosphatase [Mycolicibacterium bacteremicum]
MIANQDPTAQDAKAEPGRLDAVRRYRTVIGPDDPVLKRISVVISDVFKAPVAAVSLVDADSIWFVGSHGLDDTARIDREDGLCATAITSDRPYVVPDCRADSRTSNNRFAIEHAIRFYACVPLITFDGHHIGAVAVMDTEPRPYPTSSALSIMTNLAVVVAEQLELRLSSSEALDVEHGLRIGAEAELDSARADRDAARREADSAHLARDQARSDRDLAQRDRDRARDDRDEARLDRDTAERERDTIDDYARTLQQVLLPPSLPDIPGLEMATGYHPASPRDVSGDFYDVFALDERCWGLFIGDVQGHGVHAAVLTTLIRYTLRSALLHHREPGAALAELNTVLLREVRPRRFATVLLTTLHRGEYGHTELTLATGGHPPALLIDPATRTATPIRPDTGMLVGATPHATFGTRTLTLERGQTLLLYTDGLTEARRGATPFDDAALASYAAARAELSAGPLIDDLATLIPKLGPTDDIALLALTVTS